jgi:hypothetical protein
LLKRSEQYSRRPRRKKKLKPDQFLQDDYDMTQGRGFLS